MDRFDYQQQLCEQEERMRHEREELWKRQFLIENGKILQRSENGWKEWVASVKEQR